MLLHSGIVHLSERDPTQLFAALRRLKQSAHRWRGAPVAARLRPLATMPACEMIAAAGIADLVELAPPFPTPTRWRKC